MQRTLGIFLILIILIACNKKVIKNQPETSESNLSSSAYVIKETVNLRSNHNTNSPIIKQLNDGQPVSIIRNENGWYEINDEGHTKGWLRSDMVGPKELSRTLLATTFVDSILPAFKAEMYFDKTDLYKTIYLILPANYYESAASTENYARKIGQAYQKKVYPGDLEIRVMQPNRHDLFTQIQLKAIGDPNMPVPILKWGRLISIDQNNRKVRINVAVPAKLTNIQLLEQARSISGKYNLPYSKVEIFQAVDNTEGRTYLHNHDIKPTDSTFCRLYYLEDKDGEYYKYNFCE